MMVNVHFAGAVMQSKIVDSIERLDVGVEVLTVVRGAVGVVAGLVGLPP
jgi:hypothetical protein